MREEIVLSLREVSFVVDGRTLLHPLSLDFPKGRIIGLIGRNGSGKSTLMKILARQQAPTGGEVIFEGRSLAHWGARHLARRLAYLPQTAAAVDGMVVRELVALGRYPWHGPLGSFGPEDRARVREAMSQTGLADSGERLVETLSGGERQRAWLALLLAQDAATLLLDEPISALDLAHQVEVLSLVRRLSEERGLAVVIVLHDVNMAARYCDEIIALHGGQLIAQGTPADMLNPAVLERVFGLKLASLPHPTRGMRLCYLP